MRKQAGRPAAVKLYTQHEIEDAPVSDYLYHRADAHYAGRRVAQDIATGRTSRPAAVPHIDAPQHGRGGALFAARRVVRDPATGKPGVQTLRPSEMPRRAWLPERAQHGEQARIAADQAQAESAQLNKFRSFKTNTPGLAKGFVDRLRGWAAPHLGRVLHHVNSGSL